MNKIKKKILSLTTKVVEKYSLIQLDAKEKRDKKREEKKQLEERRESVSCPYCNTRHSSSQYYQGQTKKEDIKISKEHSTVYFNFLECLECGELFGVEENHYYGGFGIGTVRSSFLLRDKD